MSGSFEQRISDPETGKLGHDFGGQVEPFAVAPAVREAAMYRALNRYSTRNPAEACQLLSRACSEGRYALEEKTRGADLEAAAPWREDEVDGPVPVRVVACGLCPDKTPTRDRMQTAAIFRARAGHNSARVGFQRRVGAAISEQFVYAHSAFPFVVQWYYTTFLGVLYRTKRQNAGLEQVSERGLEQLKAAEISHCSMFQVNTYTIVIEGRDRDDEYGEEVEDNQSEQRNGGLKS